MASMIQNLLMVEVSHQMTKQILLKDDSPEIKSNALQKENNAIYEICHDRCHMRVQCVKGQQHANNLRRNNDINVAEMTWKLVNY